METNNGLMKQPDLTGYPYSYIVLYNDTNGKVAAGVGFSKTVPEVGAPLTLQLRGSLGWALHQNVTVTQYFPTTVFGPKCSIQIEWTTAS